jgi:hypothetical protein
VGCRDFDSGGLCRLKRVSSNSIDPGALRYARRRQIYFKFREKSRHFIREIEA